jgi:hypothetical protein
LGGGNVLSSGLFLSLSLSFIPGIPFGFFFEAEHAGGFSVDVSDGGLFEPFIEFEHFIITWFSFEVFDRFSSFIELFLGHVLM